MKIDKTRENMANKARALKQVNQELTNKFNLIGIKLSEPRIKAVQV